MKTKNTKRSQYADLDDATLNQRQDATEAALARCAPDDATSFRRLSRELFALNVEHSRRSLPSDDGDLAQAYADAMRDAGAGGHGTAYWGRVKAEALKIEAHIRQVAI